MKIWITDGSAAPFTDIVALPARHRGMLGAEVPYKGALDEAVPVGSATVFTENPADCLVPEAEWCLCFPEGTAAFAADPEVLTASTPIVMQGMIEGKWLNRFTEKLAWRPASLGNNVLARGPGIAGTLASLEDGGMHGEIRVQYTCRAGRQVYAASLSHLQGQNLLGLARSVLGHSRAAEAVNCSARGPNSALVEDRQFLQRVMTAAGVTPQELIGPAGWKRLAPQIAVAAANEGLVAERARPIDLIVTTGPAVAGSGQLTVEHREGQGRRAR